MSDRRLSRLKCPWAGTLLPPRTLEALVSQFDRDGTGRLDAAEVNATIALFNTLDHLEHISGGKAKAADLKGQLPMEQCGVGPNGQVEKAELSRVMQKFAEGPLAPSVSQLVHVLQELCEIEWVYVMWAGSKTAKMTIQETAGVLKYFNKWAISRHDPTIDGTMSMTHYDPQAYGSEINFSSFTRWVWEELSCLEEQFAEPFELTLGKLSECVEYYRAGGEPEEKVRTKARCPWSGTMVPPRTIGAWLANFKKDAAGRYAADEINIATSLFNSLDHLEHLLGGKANFASGNPKVPQCKGDADGKVSHDDVLAMFQAFAKTVDEGKLAGDGGPSVSTLSHVIHAFQELQEIEWLFVTWAGDDKNAILVKEEVAAAVKNFNKWSMPRHQHDSRGLMNMSYYDFMMYGGDITLQSFTRWVWEELSTLEELFQEPFEITLQRLTDCMQAAKVTGCFKTWDAKNSKTIDYEVLLSILSKLAGDDVDKQQVKELLDKADKRKDGKVDYPTFVELVMLQQL